MVTKFCRSQSKARPESVSQGEKKNVPEIKQPDLSRGDEISSVGQPPARDNSSNNLGEKKKTAGVCEATGRVDCGRGKKV